VHARGKKVVNYIIKKDETTFQEKRRIKLEIKIVK